MKLPVFLLAFSVLSTLGRGQAADAVTVSRDIIYAAPGNVPVRLDLYVPAGLAKPPPIVIYIHGGGWQAGGKERPLALGLTRQGFALASIDYRLSQVAVWPAQIYDCKAAVRWVRAHSAVYHYNADKIGVFGASAGGHLVALLGTTAGNTKLEGNEGNVGVSSAVQAVVDFFGPTDFISLVDQVTPEQRARIGNPVTHLFGTPLWNQGWIADKKQLAQDASPVYYVSPRSCAFFIAHGDRDPIVPPQQSVELNDALKKVGVPSTLMIVKGGGHGFNDPPTYLAATQFLKAQLASP